MARKKKASQSQVAQTADIPVLKTILNTQTEGLPEPTTPTVTLPDVPRLSLASDIVTWTSAIKNCLNVENLDGLIDNTKPRSAVLTEPLPLRWKS
jgi:hypothetical protein